MLSGPVLRLVLLVSCAHALVHTYELSLPSVEQRLADEYFPGDAVAGQRMTGLMSNCWRLTFGFGALLAGWMVDRFGGKRMLAIYLIGCSLMCAVVGSMDSRAVLFAAMFAMGAFASIYHPAGLSLISVETSPEIRPRAHGLHGIFGSAGIALAPLLAWLLIGAGMSWRQYYWLLALPGIGLGLIFALQTRRETLVRRNLTDATAQIPSREDDADWRSFVVLTLLAVLQGFIYSAVMSFLPRYMSGHSEDGSRISDATGMLWAAGALLMGCIGQYISGRIATPSNLERQLTCIAFGNAPFLLWMAFAEGTHRLIAAGSFALVHFMHQPVYNTLIAKYTPRRVRSLCYGISFTLGFGVGSLGASFNGYVVSDRLTYGVLAGVAAAAGVFGIVLVVWHRSAAITNPSE